MTAVDPVHVSAPLSELRLGMALRRYERVKLTLLVLIVALNFAAIGYLIGITSSNRVTLSRTSQSLVILRCAVAKSTSTGPDGKPLSPPDQRKAFDACVKRNS